MRGSDRKQPRAEATGQRSFSARAAGRKIGPGHALKVEARVRIQLGLTGETHRRSSRLHPGQGADTSFQTAPTPQVKRGEQAGAHVSRPAFVPQTTSPRRGAAGGLSPPAAPRRRHSLTSAVVFAPPVLRDDTKTTTATATDVAPRHAAEDADHPMRAQVDPRGAHDHHSERLHEDDDRDTGLRPSSRQTRSTAPAETVRVDASLYERPPPASPPWPARWEPRLRSLRAAERTRERSDRAVAAGKDDVKVLVKVRG